MSTTWGRNRRSTRSCYSSLYPIHFHPKPLICSHLRNNDRIRAKYTYTILMHKLDELYSLLDVVVQFHDACSSAAGVTYPLLQELLPSKTIILWSPVFYLSYMRCYFTLFVNCVRSTEIQSNNVWVLLSDQCKETYERNRPNSESIDSKIEKNRN